MEKELDGVCRIYGGLVDETDEVVLEEGFTLTEDELPLFKEQFKRLLMKDKQEDTLSLAEDFARALLHKFSDPCESLNFGIHEERLNEAWNKLKSNIEGGA